MEDAAPADCTTNRRTILGCFLFSNDDVHKRISVLSGGERARLKLARMLMRPSNVLILDEPTNHLDLPAIERLEAALADYPGALVIVSHDPVFAKACTDETWRIEGGRLQRA